MERAPLPHSLCHLRARRLPRGCARHPPLPRPRRRGRHRMFFGTRRHPVYAQRLVALDEIPKRLVFPLPARLGRKLGGKNPQPVEPHRAAQLRQYNEKPLPTALYGLERSPGGETRRKRTGQRFAAITLKKVLIKINQLKTRPSESISFRRPLSVCKLRGVAPATYATLLLPKTRRNYRNGN